MTIIRTAFALPLLAMVAACGGDDRPVPSDAAASSPSPASSPTAQPSAQAAALSVDANGLRLIDPASGQARPLPFGTTKSATLAALASRGTPELSTNSECGAGPIDHAAWPDGLTLLFQNDAFLGWDVHQPDSPASGTAPTTITGVGPGSSRAELEAGLAITVEESTLGIEFSSGGENGGIGGLLSGAEPAALVTSLWAGLTCHFR